MNPISGKNAPGYRFRFSCPKLFRFPKWLPLEMKSLPAIRRLIDGESPLRVFNVENIILCRERFSHLRRFFDFSFWAATAYQIPSADNSSRFVPLFLNPYQHKLIDIFRRRLFDGDIPRYVIVKSTKPIGLSTVIQAYILWLQLRNVNKNSFTSSPSLNNMKALKSLLFHNISNPSLFSDDTSFHQAEIKNGRYRSSGFVSKNGYSRIYIGKRHRSIFGSFRNDLTPRGIDLAYLHLSNMSSIKDDVS